MEEPLVNDNNMPDLKPDARARRKLLRGTFAAPAVLTLYSGGARAASSIATCLVKTNTNPITTGLGLTTADDMLLRVRLWGLVNNGGVSNYYIRGADLVDLQRNGLSPFLTSTQYQQFAVTNTVSTTNRLVGSPTGTLPSQPGRTFQATNQYAVLRVNSAGQVVGAGLTGSGSAVGDSCWNSFAIGTLP
jgi:hypothetical protein